VLGQTLDSQDSPRLGLGGNHHFPPYSIICVFSRHLHLNGFLSRDSQGGVSKLSRFRFPGLCEVIIVCSDLRLGWGLKQTCSFPWELSNDVSHFTWTHRGRVDSRLLVVGNVCYRCPNGPCKPIFESYTLIAFQWYKEHPNVRCFDPCNRTLKFRESQRILKSPFQECEFHLHIFSK